MWRMARLRMNIVLLSRLWLNRAASDLVVSLHLLGAESVSLHTEQFVAIYRIAFLVSVLMSSGLALFNRLVVALILGWPKLLSILLNSTSVYKANRRLSGCQLYIKH